MAQQNKSLKRKRKIENKLCLRYISQIIQDKIKLKKKNSETILIIELAD